MGSLRFNALVSLLCIWLREVESQQQKMEETLLINEVNADNPGEDTTEYVELYHVSGQSVVLRGYSLVFYNGKGNVAYNVKDLGGLSTNDQGFLLIGSANVVPRPAVILPKGTIQNGPDAIALYFGRTDLHEGMNVDNEGLVDALVHKSNKKDKADELVRVLTPGVEPFLEDPSFRTTDESLERCQGEDSQRFFQVGAPTPGLDNHCIPFSQLNASLLLINEVKIASLPGEPEFVELQGPPSTEVKDLVMALVEGDTQKMYFVLEVKGETSPDGLLLLDSGSGLSKIPDSPSSILRTGTNAVALYRGAIDHFAVGSPATSAPNLLDALVYTTAGDTRSKLLDIFTPSKPVFHVNEWSKQNGSSISRCVCCSVTRDPSAYTLAKPTPLQFNDCPTKRLGQNVALCLQGTGRCCLNAPEVQGDCQQDAPDKDIVQTVLAQALEKACSCGFSPAYFKDPTLECQGTEMIFTAFLSARSAMQLENELQALSVLVERKEMMIPLGSTNHSLMIKPCLSDASATISPPGILSEKQRTTELPTAPPPELLINELNADNPGSREDTEYIELFYPGRAPFSLENYWLVLYNGKTNLAYKVLNLTGYQTDQWGYFLVGSGGVTPTPSLVLPDTTIQNGVDAVALYRNPEGIYKTNMQVAVEGLVDAVVYRARGSDKADKLVALLTPGQKVLHEDDSHSTEDESLSRCLSLSPRDPNSFQVTLLTPFRKNACASHTPNSREESPPNSSIIINEVGLANDSSLNEFIELKGKPGDDLKKYTLHFFSRNHLRPNVSIHLQGKLGNNGLFVIQAGQIFPGDKGNDKLEVPVLWKNPSYQPEMQTVAVFSHNSSRLIGAPNAGEKLEDSLMWQARMSHQVHFLSEKGRRPLSLSHCPFCSEGFVISDPTPGLENSCPKESLALNFGMCLLTPNCSLWLQTPQILVSLQRVLLQSMEESCLCGFSLCYLQGLNFSCSNSILQLSGHVWARSPEQLQLLIRWQSNFSLSPHPFSVDGKLLKALAVCTPSDGPITVPVSAVSFETWQIALLILGSVLLLLLLMGLAFVFMKRPRNYNNIEMNDRCKIISSI